MKSFSKAKPWLVDPLIIFGFILLFFRVYVFTDATFGKVGGFADWLRLTYPSLTYTGRSLARGEFPLWNPYWFSGYPHLAVPSNGVLYPTTVLFGLLGWLVAIKWVFIGHVYLLGLFGYAVARDIFKSRLVSLFVALSLISGAFIQGMLFSGHVWSLQTMTWVPLLFLCLRRILYGGRAYWALLASAAFVPMYLGGNPQLVSYALYWLGAFTALELMYRLTIAREPWQQVGMKGVLCLGAIVLGVLLVGVQLIPSQELMAQSVRGDGVSFSYLKGYFHMSLDGYWNRAFFQHEWHWYFAGKVTLALALLSLLGKGSHERFVLWLSLAACITYAVMPDWFYHGLIKHIPVYGLARGTLRIQDIISILSCFLSAYGLSRLVGPCRDEGARKRAWIQFSLLLLAVMVLPYTKEFAFFARNWILAGVAVLGVVCALFVRRYPALSTAVLISVVAAEAWFFGGHFEAIDTANFTARKEWFLKFSEDHQDLDRVAMFGGDGYEITAQGMLTGERMFFGTHALFLRRFALLLREMGGVSLVPEDEEGRLLSQGYMKPDWLTYEALRALDLLNVRELVGIGGQLLVIETEMALGSNRFSRIPAPPNTWIYDNRGALPVANIVHELVVCDSDEEAFKILADFDFDYRGVATITGDFDTSLLAPATGRESMTMLEYEANHLKLQADMTAPGILIFSEIYYPGWKARIDDGELQDVLCIDTALRGVFLERGTHVVELIYRPESLRQGIALSSFGAVVWLGWAVLLWRRSRRERAKST